MTRTMTIKVDVNRCTGCRACELVCSGYHYKPKFSIANPERSRVRVFFDEEADVFIPVFAGPYTKAECVVRTSYKIDGKEYDECLFCPVSCPSRHLFKEPDSGLPLQCDMCGEPSPPEGPLCVSWCLENALTYSEEEDEEPEAEPNKDEKEAAIEYLIKKYGWEEIRNILERKTGR